jgi:Flp pilus assembly pilin Flp
MKSSLTVLIYEKLEKTARRARKNSESGQGMVEYALLAGLVAVIAGATMAMSPSMSDSMQKLMNKIAKYVALAAGATQAISC